MCNGLVSQSDHSKILEHDEDLLYVSFSPLLYPFAVM